MTTISPHERSYTARTILKPEEFRGVLEHADKEGKTLSLWIREAVVSRLSSDDHEGAEAA
jgi:hypothetical protein